VKITRRFIALLVLHLMMSVAAYSQQYTFIQYSVKEGLSQSQVRCLYQDSRGFIWAGTLGGISRFDGREFVNFDRRSGLLNNQINVIEELSNGVILVGSAGSVSEIYANQVKSYALEGDLKESAVNAIFQDSQGRVWIGTENGLCFFESGKGFVYPATKEIAYNDHIKAFAERNDGSIFILTKEKVCLYKDGHSAVFYQPENPAITFFDIEEDESNKIWLATKDAGLMCILPDKTVYTYLESSGLTTTTITGITSDKNGKLWLSSRFGFFEFENGKATAFDENNGLKTPDIRDILRDREGNIWLASYGSGLLKFAGLAFSAFTRSDGLSSDAIMSITQDQKGTMWFSTFDQGVCNQIEDSIIHFSFDQLLGNNRIWSSLCDSKGVMWFGSSFGLFSYDGSNFKSYGNAESDSLLDPMVISLFEDSKGRLLIGTAKGLCYIDGGAVRTFQNLSGNPETRVRDISEDRAGNIWLATRNGVFRMNEKGFTKFEEANGLPDKTAYCVEIDPMNRIWVGTQNGLALLTGDRFVSHSIGEDAGSNSVNFLKYYNGQIWLGTNNGVFSIEAGESIKEDNLRIRRYGLEDGLRSLETNLNAVFVDKSGVLWFGTTEGVMALLTSELNAKMVRTEPKIVITNVQLNFLNPDWSKFKAEVDPVSGLPINPTVDYRNNHFTFQFTGISTSYPEDVSYQFMLEGFDENWQAVTKSHFITYSNLPYQSFVFKVRAVSREGVVSEAAVFAFTVRPPFWLTWWFILLEVIAGLGLLAVILVVRRRVTRAKFEREKLEMHSRMLTLEQQSLNSSMNRHFIFNALNSIQYYINRQDRLAANKYLSDFARLIRKNLDSSEETQTPLREEIERLELYLKLEHMRFKDKFEYKIEVDPDVPQDLIKVPAMLLQPFLENSIWHGLLPKETTGRVEVKISKQGDSLHMLISDDGIGINNSLKSKLDTDSHISKGMEITKSRIELIHKMTGENIQLIGPYQVNSDSGEVLGTKVEIILPVNFSELFLQ
jgi:ligand-binding sensor domain-containing protein/two-component sensor histidine kinase